MKQFTLFFCLAFTCLMTWGYAASPSSLTWLTKYETAVSQSKSTNKPIILFFTGSDWCRYCRDLEREVFESSDFAREAGSKYIFVRLDFPLNKKLDKDLTAQNKELQKKYNIKSFPTLVILNSAQQKIGTTGYRAGGGKAYADHLNSILKDYTAYQDKMESLEKKNLSGSELRKLYSKAKALNRFNDGMKIIKTGMESSEKHYFLIERYRFLVDEGQSFDSEAITLKQRILTIDPSNRHLSHYYLAVIDFEAACEEMAKENYSPEITVAPLVTYINRFGTQDREHLWRLQMIISQVFFDRGKLDQALKYAESSYLTAPSCAQPEIATAIKSIQSQL